MVQEQDSIDIDNLPDPDNSPLRVRSLNKSYGGGIWANCDISLTMAPGEILGVLGPNGAGKTTLIRQITTELVPTSGEVTVLGHNAIADPVKVKSLLGIVPQEASLFDHLTPFQHLRIFSKLRGYRGAEARSRADELVQELQMSKFRDAHIRTLSGGMKRRLLIGIAACARPSLMVLDEPTTGLDPESRRNLWSLLLRYRNLGTSVVLTTHYTEEAESLCDRVGIIRDGKLLALDTVENLRTSSECSYKVSSGDANIRWSHEIIYGSDEQQLTAHAKSLGMQNFNIVKTNLEDVYLSLTGKEQTKDAFTDSF